MSENNNYDNEDTMLLPNDLDDQPTQNDSISNPELPPLRKKHHAADVHINYDNETSSDRNQNMNYYNDQFRRPAERRDIHQYHDIDDQPTRNYNNASYRQVTQQPQNNYQRQNRPVNPQPRNNYYQSAPQQYQQRRNEERRGDYYYDDPNYNEQRSVPEYHASYRSAPQKQQKSPKKHKSFLGRVVRRFLWFIFLIVFIIFGVYSCTSLCLISKVDKVKGNGHAHTGDSLSASYVKSILVLGTDSRSTDDSGRSDSMILVSLNSRTKEMTMTSFMRDCYVEIPNYGWNKLNAAFAFGGAELVMETIEHNFGVQIDNYISFDFMSFASVIDSVGGIDVDVSDAEAEEINNILISEVNEIVGDDRMSDLLSGGGHLHLVGKQALSYARIRKVGNSDFERTERQRKVIELMFDRMTSFNPAMLPKLAINAIPNVSSNMSAAEMYLFSLRLPLAAVYEKKQLQIPYENTFYSDSYDVGDVLCVDFDSNYNVILDTVFAD